MTSNDMIYPVTLYIAKARDGRNILYDVNVKIKEGVATDKIATSQLAKRQVEQAVRVTTPSAYSISQNTQNVNKNNDNSAKFSVSAKESGKTYLDAVKRGDTETARRTVDEAAKAASPITDVAPTGSKEARQLEKVKKTFEDAYRSGGKLPTEAKYSLIGKTKDGIEVYKTSKEIMDLSWNERKAKYLDVMKNEYRGRTAKFERNGHVYYAEFDQSSLRKPIYGDERSSPNGTKALIKVGADGDIFDLVENSQYRRSKPNTKDHTEADYFDYFVKTIQIDGKVFDLVADVEKKHGVDGGYVYTLALTDNKKIKASPTHGLTPVKNVGNAFNNSIAQNKPNVNKNNDNSAKFSVSAKESGKTYLDAVKRGDTETARRKVDEAAKAASPITDVAPTGSKEARQLEKVKKTFEDAYRSGGKLPTETKNSIVVLDDGKVYVDASRNVIKGNTRAEQRKNITNFFSELLGDNPSLDIHTIEGDVLTITKAETAEKARDDHKIVDGKRVELSDEEFAVKMHTEAHIDEIAEVSKPIGGKEDNKNHPFAKDGFTYRRAYFKDFDGQYYEVTLSIGHNGTVATVYNVGKIKESVPPSAKIIAVAGSKPLGKTPSAYSISQNSEKSIGNEKNLFPTRETRLLLSAA